METKGRLIAGSRNRNEFVLINEDEIGRVCEIPITWRYSVIRYKPLAIKVCQWPSFAIAGIQCYSTVISLYKKMCAQHNYQGNGGGDSNQPRMDAVNNGTSFIGVERSNLDITCSEEGRIIMQERKKGKSGVKIEIPLEKVLQYSGLKRDDAAKKLEVSSSTLKRVCRQYGIGRWPPRNIDNVGAPQPLHDVPPRNLDKVRSSWALPVFEDSSQVCVGVLELVSAVDTITDWHDKSFLQNLYDGLQEEEVFASALPEHSNSDATCSEEGTITERKRKKGKTGVRIEIPQEEILQCSKMKLDDAARQLNVSSSTLKHICRDYGIRRWPPRKIDKVGAPQPSRDVPARNIDKVGTPQPSRVVLQEGISQLTSDVPPNQASDGRDYRIHLGPPQNRNKVSVDDVHIQPHNAASREMEMVMIKAKYSEYTIKFRLSMSSGMQELQLEVAKRLRLEAGTYDICYKDEDDEFILVACDEDLQCCMQTSRSLGSTTVRIVILPRSK